MTKKKLTCLVIGETSLPIRCIEILLEKGHEVFGFITNDKLGADWAAQNNINGFNTISECLSFLDNQTLDLIFSISNKTILPESVIDRAVIGVINYHDAILPKFAGSFATSWAIIKQQKLHGVSWHLTNQIIDGGNILKQFPVQIEEKETAFTLNSKCFNAAITSFSELIDELANGLLTPIKQNLAERTYYSRNKRPSGCCVFEWNHSANELDSLVRGLEFGPYSNPFGTAKLYMNGEVVIVAKTTIETETAFIRPGVITKLDQNYIKVSTGENELVLQKLLNQNGQVIPISDFIVKYNLFKGYQLDAIETELLRKITKFSEEILNSEAFWLQRLAALQPFTLDSLQPFIKSPKIQLNSGEDLANSYKTISLKNKNLTINKLSFEGKSNNDIFIAIFIAFLARISEEWMFDLFFSYPTLKNNIKSINQFFADVVPIQISIKPGFTFQKVLTIVQNQIELAKNHKTFSKDIWYRYSGFASTPKLGTEQALNIGVEQVIQLDDYEVKNGNDLIFLVQENTCELALVFNIQKFDKYGIERLIQSFDIFLEGIVEEPTLPIAKLPLLPPHEKHQLLYQWNNTRSPLPQHLSLPALFEAQVRLNPHAIAVTFQQHSLSYLALNQRVNHLAHFLRSQGIGPEKLVGVCFQRSLDMLIALLAVLKAGGAYLPLDPTYPPERLAFMLEDAKPALLLTHSALLTSLPALTDPALALALDLLWPHLLRTYSSHNPPAILVPSNLAYVIYTSGSTGLPKAAMNSHQAICNRLIWQQPPYQITHDDRLLQKTPFSFDVSVWEFFWPLVHAATLVIAPPAVHQDSAELVKLIHKEAISIAHFVPSMLQLFAQEPNLSGCVSLRQVMCSGEALPYQLVTRFQDRHPAQIHNLYGPTEAAVDVTYWKCVREEQADEAAGIVPIGRPIANIHLHILDRYQQLVPVGVAGELYIGGMGVGRGYLNRPELTAQKFVPDPFSDIPGARLYRTGDRVRWLSNGSIEFLGRLDYQVKIRGNRVELGEIEKVLEQHSAIREAVVVVKEEREQSPGRGRGQGQEQEQEQGVTQRLVAYVVAKEGASRISGIEVRKYLRQRLPEYMLPNGVMWLKEMPLNSNGKLDRSKLPLEELEQAAPISSLEVPLSKTEQAIAKIWCEVLGLSKVGTEDNFFELGGHSLLLARIYTRLKQEFQENLSLVDLFRFPTVQAITQYINLQKPEGKVSQKTKERANLQKNFFTQQGPSFRRRLNDFHSNK